MATTTSVCTTCLHALRQQLRHSLPLRHPSASPLRQLTRALSNSTHHLAPPAAPRPNQKPPPPAKFPSPPPPSDTFAHLATSLRNTSALRGATEPLVAYGVTESLFHACAAQCDYTIPARLQTPPGPAPRDSGGEELGVGRGWWYAARRPPRGDTGGAGGLGLTVTFSSWAQVLFLHLYVVTARLRAFPAAHARVWHQNLLDHFFYAAEDRMAVWHGMAARGTRNKYLKDLWLQWRGVVLSYDEGVVRGDAVLAAAVWRNVFKADDTVDVGDVAVVVAYLRSQMRKLDRMSDEEVASGRLAFDDPEGVRALVARESVWMSRPFAPEQSPAV